MKSTGYFVIIILINFKKTESRPLDKGKTIEYCSQLDETILKIILGPAYNPRYMSIEEPSVSSSSSSSSKYSKLNNGDNNNKRAYYDEETFFVDNTYQSEISNRPAWDVDHMETVTGSVKSQHISTRSIENDYDDNKSLDKLSSFSSSSSSSSSNTRDIRRIFIEKISSPARDKVFSKGRPWECEAKITWIDLGVMYYPRYLRTVECTRKECWYGHYTCKPKSFTIKVLRRHVGECIRINKKLKLFASINHSQLKTDNDRDFTELWTWEEKAINFCCDCVVA